MISIIGFLLWLEVTAGVQHYEELTAEYEYNHAPFYVSILIEAENDVWSIYGEYRNEMEKGKSYMFIPEVDYFTVGVSAYLDDNVMLGFEHMCQHPVANYEEPVKGEYGGYSTIYVSIGGKH